MISMISSHHTYGGIWADVFILLGIVLIIIIIIIIWKDKNDHDDDDDHNSDGFIEGMIGHRRFRYQK